VRGNGNRDVSLIVVEKTRNQREGSNGMGNSSPVERATKNQLEDCSSPSRRGTGVDNPHKVKIIRGRDRGKKAPEKKTPGVFNNLEKHKSRNEMDAGNRKSPR